MLGRLRRQQLCQVNNGDQSAAIIEKTSDADGCVRHLADLNQRQHFHDLGRFNGKPVRSQFKQEVEHERGELNFETGNTVLHSTGRIAQLIDRLIRQTQRFNGLLGGFRELQQGFTDLLRAHGL